MGLHIEGIGDLRAFEALAARARALGKPLRYSFGRADREYKDRWCHRVPVFQV